MKTALSEARTALLLAAVLVVLVSVGVVLASVGVATVLVVMLVALVTAVAAGELSGEGPLDDLRERGVDVDRLADVPDRPEPALMATTSSRRFDASGPTM